MARKIPCSVHPVVSPRSCSRSPQHINGRLSPSPISSPRAASGASTPPGGGHLGATPQYHLNLHEGGGMVAMPQNAFPAHGNGSQEHKPDIFRGLIQAHLSLESVSRENDIRGNKVERPVLHGKKEQSYDSHLVLADRVSQQLLRNPVRLNQGTELKPSSSLPSHRNRS